MRKTDHTESCEIVVGAEELIIAVVTILHAARNDLRIGKPQRPALLEQHDLFKGFAEIELKIRPVPVAN